MHLHRLVHGSSYTLHVRFPLIVFFFAGAVNKLKDCLWSWWKWHPVHLIELPSHLPAMIDWRRNVWVTLQASPVHCSLGACPLNMFVQRVLVWRQVSLRISARLEQCSPGLIHFLRGQSIEVIGQCILFLNLVFCMLSPLYSVEIQVRIGVATKRQCQYKDICVFIQMAWHLLPCAMMTVTLPISLCRRGPVFKYIILQISIVFPHMPDIFFHCFGVFCTCPWILIFCYPCSAHVICNLTM